MSDDILADLQADCLRWAAVAGEVYKALRDLDLPEQLCCDLTYAWLAPSDDD